MLSSREFLTPSSLLMQKIHLQSGRGKWQGTHAKCNGPVGLHVVLAVSQLEKGHICLVQA